MAQGLSRKRTFPRSVWRVSTFACLFTPKNTTAMMSAMRQFALAFFSLVRPHSIIIFTLADHWSDRHLHGNANEEKAAGFVSNICAFIVYLNERFVISKERKSSIGDECDCVTRVCRPAFSRAIKFILLAQSKIYLFNKFFSVFAQVKWLNDRMICTRYVPSEWNLTSFITKRFDEIRAATSRRHV